MAISSSCGVCDCRVAPSVPDIPGPMAHPAGMIGIRRAGADCRVAISASYQYGVCVLSPGERCPARIELSGFQLLWLRRRPDSTQAARPDQECQLEFRHNGPHAALGQQGGEIEWWVRWTLTSSTVEQVMACPAVRDEPSEPSEPGEPRESDPCLLFEGHPGRHSFDLAQW